MHIFQFWDNFEEPVWLPPQREVTPRGPVFPGGSLLPGSRPEMFVLDMFDA
jgi:hypothetical protein